MDESLEARVGCCQFYVSARWCLGPVPVRRLGVGGRLSGCLSRRRRGRWGTGAPGEEGQPGLEGGATPGLEIAVQMSPPVSGAYFWVGEQVRVTVELNDDRGFPIYPNELSQARPMIVGPKGALDTVTAVDLLNVSDDRSESVHHYVNCNGDEENANLAVEGNKLTFTKQPVSSEEAGAYVVGFWAGVDEYPIGQAFPTREFQIGTGTQQPDIVGDCDNCHFDPTPDDARNGDEQESCEVCHGGDADCAVEEVHRISDPFVPPYPKEAAGDQALSLEEHSLPPASAARYEAVPNLKRNRRCTLHEHGFRSV